MTKSTQINAKVQELEGINDDDDDNDDDNDDDKICFPTKRLIFENFEFSKIFPHCNAYYSVQ